MGRLIESVRLSRRISLGRACYWPLVFVYFFGVYSYIGVNLNGIPVPAVISLAATIPLMLTTRIPIYKNKVHAVSLFVVVCLVSALLGYDPRGEFLVERLKSVALLVYSASLAYVIYVVLKQRSRQEVARFFLILIILVEVGCLLEITAGFRSITEAFADAVYATRYTAEQRDVRYFGIVRPLMLTAEPSHIAQSLLFYINIWYLLADRRSKDLYFWVAIGVGVLLVRSPIMLLALPIFAATKCFGPGFGKEAKNPISRALIFVVSIVALILAVLVFASVFQVRTEAMMAFQDESIIVRVIAPLFVTYDMLTTSPLFGAGFGGKQVMFGVLEEMYASFGVNYLRFDSYETTFNNFFFEYFQYFGLLGASVGAIWLHKLVKAFSGKNFLYIYSLLVIYGQSFGGLNTPRFWVFFLVLLLATSRSHDGRVADDGVAHGYHAVRVQPSWGLGGHDIGTLTHDRTLGKHTR